MSVTPRLIPDAECAQGKCGCTTTGCWDECAMKRVQAGIVPGALVGTGTGIYTFVSPDTRIADLETALRAAQATIGGLEMEVARMTVALQAAQRGPAAEKAGDLGERIKNKVMGRLELRGLLIGIGHKSVRILGYELLNDLEAVLPDDRVASMVNRFLGWPLPKTFGPDCGISFDGRKDDEWNKNKSWPIGTNLLTAIEAKAMFEYCLSPTANGAAGQEGA